MIPFEFILRHAPMHLRLEIKKKCKVNPSHPDKIADRIAGAIVDLAYQVQSDPKIAVEVLIGHGVCHIIVETSAPLLMPEALRAIHNAVRRIAGMVQVDLTIVPQDTHLPEPHHH